MKKMDPYETLGVPRDASTADVRNAYRAQAKRAHPDGGGTPERFAQLVLARDVLSDAQRRQKYDATGEIGETPVDNIDARAMNMVMQAVDHVFMTCHQRGIKVEEVDAISDAKKWLSAKLIELKNNQNKGKEHAKKLRSYAERFVNKGPNKIRMMLESRAAEIEREIAKTDTDVVVMEKALGMSAEYEYKYAVNTDFAFPGVRIMGVGF